MGEYFFVSYSAVDGAEFALSLADKLAAGPPPYHLWVDCRELQPGDDWDEQIVEAIRGCRGLLFVMTADSVRAGSVSKDEWVRALKYKKPVIPLRLHVEAELPFRLGSRQFVDFSDFDVGVARLREYLAWTTRPEGVLSELRTRRADAERELPRADPERRPQIEKEIADLDRRIAAQQQAIEEPLTAQAQTSERIEAGLERARQPEKQVAEVGVSRARFVNPPPMAAPGYFQDRHVETRQIGDFLRTADLRVMTLAGRGGLGKTAMACRLLKALEGGRLPDESGELAVGGVVYLSPVGGHPVNFPNLFADLCRLLPADQAKTLTERYRDPQQTPAQLMLALLEAFPREALAGPSVVLLDNLEDLIDSETGAITDAPLDEALRTVLTGPDHGVKLILTTRVVAQKLLLVEPGRQRRLNLDEGLDSPYAENILRAMDPDASLGLRNAPDQLLALARKRTRGFPRALEALAAILSADRDTTLPELLAEAARLPGNVVEALVGEAFSRLDLLAQQVMQALAVFPVPVPAVAIDYLLQPHRATIDASPVLSRLVNMAFVRRDAGQYYLHQVDRDYALAHIPAGELTDRDTDPPPFTQQALRRRGADYFEATRTPRETWETLDDLGPQLAEFELRCANADYNAAAAVLYDIDGDYLQQWGHYRLAADMHKRLLGRLTDPHWQMANVGNLGLIYVTLGQTERAIEHTQQALAIARQTGSRTEEGVWLGALGDTYRTLGQIERAIEHTQQALAIARETGNLLLEGALLGTLGNIYYVQGQTERTIEHYQQAVAIARETGYGEFEGIWLGALGVGYRDLGQTERAIEHTQQALAIARQFHDRKSEGMWLGNLSECYADLGQIERAIEHTQQALAIAREIGDRSGEASCLTHVGNFYSALGQTDLAIEHIQQAVEIGDDIGEAQVQAEARLGLARVHLYREEWPAARQVAETAATRGYRPILAQVFVALGTAYLRAGDRANAGEAFSAALSVANTLLAGTDGPVDVLYAKGIASAGQAVTGQPDAAQAARRTFTQALTGASAPGFRARALRQLDLLASVDADGVLTEIRHVLAEQLHDPA